jgi:hypothetical protein
LWSWKIPAHVTIRELMVKRYGLERTDEMQPLRSLLGAGIPLTPGSDGPNKPYLNITPGCEGGLSSGAVRTFPNEPVSSETQRPRGTAAWSRWLAVTALAPIATRAAA